MAQAVKRLPCKCEALSSNPSPTAHTKNPNKYLKYNRHREMPHSVLLTINDLRNKIGGDK
jgi:hypothetical protein